jgi:hypothetical protein
MFARNQETVGETSRVNENIPRHLYNYIEVLELSRARIYPIYNILKIQYSFTDHDSELTDGSVPTRPLLSDWLIK